MAWSFAHWLKSRATPAAEHAILAAEHARRAGDEGMRARALGHYLGTLSFGDTDAKTIAAEVDRIERDASGPFLAAWLDLARGQLVDLAGDFDEGVRLAQRTVDALLDMGLLTVAGGAYQNVARIRQRAGDLEGALADLQRGDQMLADLGEHSYRSTTQAMLAELHEQLGDRAAALATIDLALKLGAPEDVINYAITHGVRARIALSDRDFEGAERWATSALDYAYQTDFLSIRAGAKTTLARVLAESGRTGAAAEELQATRALYRAKGDVPAAAHVDALLAAL
jgi:tetratricopeptide (TPR) repeat protein